MRARFRNDATMSPSLCSRPLLRHFGGRGTARGRLSALAAGQRSAATRSPETGDLELQIAMVAGARCRQYRPRYTLSPLSR
jgi:hypothetical protein